MEKHCMRKCLKQKVYRQYSWPSISLHQSCLALWENIMVSNDLFRKTTILSCFHSTSKCLKNQKDHDSRKKLNHVTNLLIWELREIGKLLIREEIWTVVLEYDLHGDKFVLDNNYLVIRQLFIKMDFIEVVDGYAEMTAQESSFIPSERFTNDSPSYSLTFWLRLNRFPKNKTLYTIFHKG